MADRGAFGLGNIGKAGSSADKQGSLKKLNVNGPLSDGAGRPGVPHTRESDSFERPYNEGSPRNEWQK